MTDAARRALVDGLLGNGLVKLDETNVVDLSRTKIRRVDDHVRRRHVELIGTERDFDLFGVVTTLSCSNYCTVADDSREARPACLVIKEPSIGYRSEIVFKRSGLTN